MARLSTELLDQARMLARREPKRPKQASLRRAISTAYYALFHFLIEEAVTAQVKAGDTIVRELRCLAARAVAHIKMKDVCKQFGKARASEMPLLLQPFARQLGFAGNQDLRDVTEALIELQELRHQADYDMAALFTRPQAVGASDLCLDAMDAWNRLKLAAPDTAKVFTLYLLLSSGLSNR